MKSIRTCELESLQKRRLLLFPRASNLTESVLGLWARPPVKKPLPLQRLARTLNVTFADLALRCRHKNNSRSGQRQRRNARTHTHLLATIESREHQHVWQRKRKNDDACKVVRQEDMKLIGAQELLQKRTNSGWTVGGFSLTFRAKTAFAVNAGYSPALPSPLAFAHSQHRRRQLSEHRFACGESFLQHNHQSCTVLREPAVQFRSLTRKVSFPADFRSLAKAGVTPVSMSFGPPSTSQAPRMLAEAFKRTAFQANSSFSVITFVLAQGSTFLAPASRSSTSMPFSRVGDSACRYDLPLSRLTIAIEDGPKVSSTSMPPSL